MLLLSVSIGAFCGLGGLYANFYVDVSSGPSVVLFSAAVFFIVLTYTSLRSALHLSPRKRKACPRESNTPRKRGAL